MKKNDIITLKIEDITNLGFGVGKADGAVVFVASAVPGDVCEVKIIKVASSYFVGKIETFIEHSKIRTVGRCDNQKCRSCAYRSILYEEELKIKQGTVRSAFLKEGLSDIKILPTVPSPKLCEYRNKAQYPVSRSKDGEYIIGFYAPKSHNVCEASDCPMAPSVFAKILSFLRDFLKQYNISVYDETNGTGLLRHIYLRRSEAFGEVLLTLVINGTSFPHSEELVQEATELFPEICGILLNLNKKDTNIILGDEYITLFGNDYLTDILADVKLKITAPAFYQVNHGTATNIYNEARKLARIEKTDTLIDIYCGAGSIGLSMAEDAGELIGIELIESAVECARFNAKENKIWNAKFYTGDAANAEKLLEHAEQSLGKRIFPDVVILDPPRAGCDGKLLSFVASLSPKRIVYISCNPTTLARDVKIFKSLGYNTNEVKPFDMFPMTGHVESVVCLKRQIQQ